MTTNYGEVMYLNAHELSFSTQDYYTPSHHPPQPVEAPVIVNILRRFCGNSAAYCTAVDSPSPQHRERPLWINSRRALNAFSILK